MVTISIYGLDQYTVGHYSKDHTKNIANLFEISEEQICFYAPDAYVFHKGVEQTSWNTIVKINAPEFLEVNEEKVAKYIQNTLSEFTIHLFIEFYYFKKSHRYERINKEYPRFIKEDNLVNAEEEEYSEGDELYEGNIFEGLEEKLEDAARIKERELKEEHEHHHDCECGECHCHHHEDD